MSQSGVEAYSQNFIMPKRSRSSTSSSLSKRARSSKSRTNGVKKIWPYASKGTGPMWDPFPAQMQAKLRYSETITLDPNLGVPAHNLFRCNSIFDPNYTGVGHQPYGHDTYQLIYNHYNVVSATITMTPTSSFSNANGMYGISITDDVSVQADYNTIREVKTTKFATLNTTRTADSLTNYYSQKQVFRKGNNFDTQAIFGNNPGEGQFFHCWFEGSGPTDDPAGVDFVITITYVVNMWELRDLGQS